MITVIILWSTAGLPSGLLLWNTRTKDFVCIFICPYLLHASPTYPVNITWEYKLWEFSTSLSNFMTSPIIWFVDPNILLSSIFPIILKSHVFTSQKGFTYVARSVKRYRRTWLEISPKQTVKWEWANVDHDARVITAFSNQSSSHFFCSSLSCSVALAIWSCAFTKMPVLSPCPVSRLLLIKLQLFDG